MGSDAAAAQRQSPPCLEHHSFTFLTAISVFSNRLTELNLREVYQMVMLTAVSCMKYLTYSSLHKIVHLHRDLRDVNRCPWGGVRKSMSDNCMIDSSNIQLSPTVTILSKAAHPWLTGLPSTLSSEFTIFRFGNWRLEDNTLRLRRERIAVSSRWIVTLI